MPTIKDVARLAEVSVATVSRVLNGNGYVHVHTEEKVKQAINELNYHPNDVARSLFKGKSKMIALLVPDIMNPFFPALARAVEDLAKIKGYTFVLCNTDDEAEKELTYIQALKQKSVDGIVIVSSSITEDSIKQLDLPVVALDRALHKSLSLVSVNNEEGAKAAVAYLKEIGCKKIGHIAGPEHVTNAQDRLKGYLAMVQDEEWFHASLIQQGNYNFEEAKNAAIRLLTNQPDIDGLFVANDLMGAGVIKAAQYLGIQIPDQLAVIGFDGISIGETTSPTLTTMAQPIYEMGAKAAEILIREIENDVEAKQLEEFKVKLVERESTMRGGLT